MNEQQQQLIAIWHPIISVSARLSSTFLFRQSFPTLLHLRGLRNSSAILATLEIFDWNWQQQLWLDLLDGIQWGPVDSVGKERPPCFGPSDTVGRRQCRQMTLARRRWWITVIEDLLHHSVPTTQHTLHTATYCSLDSAVTKTNRFCSNKDYRTSCFRHQRAFSAAGPTACNSLPILSGTQQAVQSVSRIYSKCICWCNTSESIHSWGFLDDTYIHPFNGPLSGTTRGCRY